MPTDRTLAFKDEKDMAALIAVALGRQNADLAVLNARLVNVYTGEIQNGVSVAVKDKWIAYVGPDAGFAVGKETEVIDAAGKTLIPGFIEGHTHIAWLFTPAEFLKYTIPGGTTTIVTETLEPYPVCGYAGVVDFLESLKNQPIKFLATAPPMVSTSQAAIGIDAADLARLLDREDIVGIGESYWQGVFQAPETFLPLMAQALSAGKTLEGHSAGARDKKLNAYLSTGVSSCHEPIDADQVLERLRLGLHVMVREGSIRRDLAAISRIKDAGVSMRRLVLSTDGVTPEDLLDKGFMEYVVQKAVDCGFDPICAVQMATLNVAEHFGLDKQVGGIAPGRFADMLIIPSPDRIEPEWVISNGRVIAKSGRTLVPPRGHQFAPASLASIRLKENLSAADFRIPAQGGRATVTARVIDMVTDLVTAEKALELPVANGEIRQEIAGDILKVAAVDRTRRPGKKFVGLIHGFGLTEGAMACSASWDTSDIVVVGAVDQDMADAVNRVRELQGGAVVCSGGRVLAELPMPVFGLMSGLAIPAIVDGLKDIRRAAAGLGVEFPDPLLTLITLTGAAIPYLRICEEGLVNLKDGKTAGLFI
jgi:adenine deaminase